MRIVIVGAGHAGVALADNLRRRRFEGSITLVSDEQRLPYHRPPLSKGVLAADGAGPPALRPHGFYAGEVSLRHEGARAIQPAQRTVTLGSGEHLGYDRLVLATGSRPRRLAVPGAGQDGVFHLRSALDAERLSGALAPGARLVIVGAGYVGLEVAASARRRGCEVTLIERAERVLARSASPDFAARIEALHRDNGVDIRLGRTVSELVGDGAVRAVHTSEGDAIACDCVLVGIGAEPASGLAEAAGLTCADGICVDASHATSTPDIFALGDCASVPSLRYGRHIRHESIGAAQAQARVLAAVLAKDEPPPEELPWFWSDQYGHKLQMAGLPMRADRLVVEDSADNGGLSILHERAGRICAVECLDRPDAYIAAKRTMEAAGR